MTAINHFNGITGAEPLIRAAIFVAVLALLMGWEVGAPRRALSIKRGQRWPGNVGAVVIGAVLVRLFFPAAAVGMALVAEAIGWGVLNRAQPAGGHDGMTVGLPLFRDPAELRLDRMLVQPLRRDSEQETAG